MLRLVWTDCDTADLHVLPPMSAYRRAKEQKYRLDSARRAGLCAEWLLIRALEKEDAALQLPLSIVCEDKGKPRLAGEEFRFNLSHSGAFAACALADFPLGLDIQLQPPGDLSRLARRFFSEKEQAAMADSCDSAALFTRLWCRKESFLKAIGLGLRVDLRALDLSDKTPRVPFEGQTYGFREAREGSLFFCLCAPDRLLPDEIAPEKLTLP